MAFVCSCEVVTTRTVRDAIARGACTVEQIGDDCRAGTNCCGCHPTLEAMLAESEVRVAPARATGAEPAALMAS